MKLCLKRWSRALHLGSMFKGAAVGAHCKPCALLEASVWVLFPCVGKTVIRLCRSKRERLFKNCFNMAPAITLSELAWIFKRELAIMIPLCLFPSRFYFSQGREKKKTKNRIWGSRVRPILPLPWEGAQDRKPRQQNPSHLILLPWLMSSASKEVNSGIQAQLHGGWAGQHGDRCLGLWKGEVVSPLDACYRQSNGAGRLKAVRLQTTISAGKYICSLLYLQRNVSHS